MKTLEGMTWTARKMASWVGTLMWKTRIAGDPLFAMRKEIELVKWASDRTSRADWDRVIGKEDMEQHWSVLEVMRAKIRVAEFYALMYA